VEAGTWLTLGYYLILAFILASEFGKQDRLPTDRLGFRAVVLMIVAWPALIFWILIGVFYENEGGQGEEKPR